MTTYGNDFESRIPLDHLPFLLDLGAEYGFDPTSSIEMEEFFCRLIGGFDGSGEGMHEWLRKGVEEAFRYVSSRPDWIQNPDWPISRSGPMLFVGQVIAPPVPNIFHDDAAFYVFFEPSTGETRTVMQIS